jgi:glucokinase
MENFSCKDVFDTAAGGDAVACEILDIVYHYLAEFFGNLCVTVDPEIIVIGGGVSKAGQPLLDGVRQYLREYQIFATRNVELALATLGNDAGAYGACKLVLDAYK